MVDNDKELLNGPKQNHLYFTGDFGFVVRGSEIDTWFLIRGLEARNCDLALVPIKPEAFEFIEEFILWAKEKNFDFGIYEKEDYEFRINHKKHIIQGKSFVILCEDESDQRYLTKNMERFWKQICYGMDGNKVGFSGSKKYFEIQNENT